MCCICHIIVFPYELYICHRRPVNFRRLSWRRNSPPLPSPGQQPSHRTPYQSHPHPYSCFVPGSTLASQGSRLNDVLSEANTDHDNFPVCFPSHPGQNTGRPGFLLSGSPVTPPFWNPMMWTAPLSACDCFCETFPRVEHRKLSFQTYHSVWFYELCSNCPRIYSKEPWTPATAVFQRIREAWVTRKGLSILLGVHPYLFLVRWEGLLQKDS